jgi:hypothetical protein
MVGEKPQLPVGSISDHILINTGRYENILAADVDSHTIVLTLRMERLLHAVAGHAHDVEVDPKGIAPRVLVVRGKIPKDAASDLPSLSAHTDTLADQHAAVDLHAYVAAELLDQFSGLRQSAHKQQRGENSLQQRSERCVQDADSSSKYSRG